MEAVVVNCDILVNSGTPTNFSEGPPHFCAELEVLDHLYPSSLFQADGELLSKQCSHTVAQREPKWSTQPIHFGDEDKEWPVLCEIFGNEIDPEIEETKYEWTGNVRFRKMISGKPYVVVEHFSPNGITVNETLLL